MNKDRVKGKAKDIAGRVERQVGEWTGDPEKQGKGAAKQVEGKLQNAWGKLKDGVKKTGASKPSAPKPPQRTEDNEDADERDVRSAGR
jgi:uncharacterized protein YjbJ (UPF0337 family)